VAATSKLAYIGYDSPRFSIESVPLGGGAPTYVTHGMSPALSPDGTKMALFRLLPAHHTAIDEVVVRNLRTGSERTVYSATGVNVVNRLSWSPDSSELAMTGTFSSSPTAGIGDFRLGVQILALDEPISATNPHFVGMSTTISGDSATFADAQFLGSSGRLAGLTGGPLEACQPTSSVVASLDPATGQSVIVSAFPFGVAHVVFDQHGTLIAYEKYPATPCPPPTPKGEKGTAAITASIAHWGLYGWVNGTSRHLVNDVIAATAVP